MNPYEFAIDVVQRAGEILKNAAQQIHISHKGDDTRDVVTNVDVEINNFLVSEIRRVFPAHRIYSEESVETSGSGEFEWTIDPIDGSANFAKGIPHFAVCVGLLRAGIPIVGAVYNPITQELFSFEEGRGAFINGIPMHASSVTEPKDAQGLIIVGHQPPLWDWGTAVYRSFLEHLKKTKALGSSSLDLCFLAAGRADIVVYGTMTARDIACAIGIVRAAGGDVYTLYGIPLELSSTRQTIVATATKALLAHAEPLLHAELLPR
jgi:myo-inositol-1(or 4)-monophosphatase